MENKDDPQIRSVKSDRKDHLETKKLELEIKELELIWWKKPSYLGIILTSLIAVTSVLIGLYTGIIDDTKKKQEKQIHENNLEIDSLQKAGDKLRNQNLLLIDSASNSRLRNEKLLIEKKTALELLEQQKAENQKLFEKFRDLKLKGETDKIVELKVTQYLHAHEFLTQSLTSTIEKLKIQGLPLPNEAKIDIQRSGKFLIDANITFSYNYSNTLSEFKHDINSTGEYATSEFKAISILLTEWLKKIKEENNIDKTNVKINITGLADGVPFSPRGLAHRVEMEEIKNETYYSINDSAYKKLNELKSEPLNSNEALAVLRGYYIKKQLLESKIVEKDNIGIATKTTEKIGQKYRQIEIEIKLPGAFLKLFEDLDAQAKQKLIETIEKNKH